MSRTKDFASIMVVCSVIIIIAALTEVWLWYTGTYGYFCPLADQCGSIFAQSNEPAGSDVIALIVTGVTGIIIGVAILHKDKRSKPRELKSQPAQF